MSSVHLLWELQNGPSIWRQRQLGGRGRLAGHKTRPLQSRYHTYTPHFIPSHFTVIWIKCGTSYRKLVTELCVWCFRKASDDAPERFHRERKEHHHQTRRGDVWSQEHGSHGQRKTTAYCVLHKNKSRLYLIINTPISHDMKPLTGEDTNLNTGWSASSLKCFN